MIDSLLVGIMLVGGIAALITAGVSAVVGAFNAYSPSRPGERRKGLWQLGGALVLFVLMVAAVDYAGVGPRGPMRCEVDGNVTVCQRR